MTTDRALCANCEARAGRHFDRLTAAGWTCGGHRQGEPPMTRDELDRIPDHLLKRSGRVGLLLWLKLSGLTMTLAELDDERRRRGIMRERG